MQSQVAKRSVLIVLLDAQGKLTRYGDANRIKEWIEGLQAVREKHRA
jgi:D-alanyl-D-alanine endopeptidase (penicillin-binding protein 7)